MAVTRPNCNNLAINASRNACGMCKKPFHCLVVNEFFHEEIESVADPKEREIWQKYVDNVEFGKTEGAMLYAPFL